MTTFNPNLPDVDRIIKKHLHIVDSNPKLKELFPPNSIIPSFRRSKNLKELLAPSGYRTTSEVETVVIKDAPNVKEVDVIFELISVSNLSLFSVSKRTEITPFGQNCLVIQKMLSI